MKRTAIVYKRTAIKRAGRFKVVTRVAIKRYKEVKVWDKVFIVDTAPETAMKIENAIGKRMFVCFGRTNMLNPQDQKKFMPERIQYLTRHKKTINVTTQTIRTMEERNALLGNIKTHG
jgi:hypothetical protein